MSVSSLEQDLSSLMSILGRLLKALRHSDPSAKHVQSVLSSKYKAMCNQVIFTYKGKVTWNQINEVLCHIPIDTLSAADTKDRESILRRVEKDLADNFFEKPVFQDFSQDSPPKRPRKKVKKKKKNLASVSSNQKEYTKDDLFYFASKVDKVREGKETLHTLVAKLREIDPEKLEQKIKLSLKSSHVDIED